MVGTEVGGVKCFDLAELDEQIAALGISVAILTVPPKFAQAVADQLVFAGVQAILSFASIQLSVPDSVFVENYDMTTALETVAYFARAD